MKDFHCGNFRQHQGIVSSSLKCDPLKRCHGENRSHPSGVFEQNVHLGLQSRLIKRVYFVSDGWTAVVQRLIDILWREPALELTNIV